MFAWLTQETQNIWMFWATMVSVTILIVGTVAGLVKWWQYKHPHPFKVFRYIIPKRGWSYIGKTFDTAPNEERQPETLTVGVGKYDLLYVLTAQENLTIRYMYPPIFEGQEDNRPKVVNPTIYSLISIRRDDFRVFCHRIQTIGNWNGRAIFEFYVENARKVIRRLTFNVSTSELLDEIPFLKVLRNDYKQPT